jgi:hypothetical protein
LKSIKIVLGCRYWDLLGFGFGICYPIIPLFGWFWNWSEELAPNIAHLSHMKERARPRFRGLSLCIRPKSLPFPSPTPHAYPFVTQLEKKKCERATPKRGGRDGRGDGRLTPTADALSVDELSLAPSFSYIYDQPPSFSLPAGLSSC